jgi:hypothetical protein
VPDSIFNKQPRRNANSADRHRKEEVLNLIHPVERGSNYQSMKAIYPLMYGALIAPLYDFKIRQTDKSVQCNRALGLNILRLFLL